MGLSCRLCQDSQEAGYNRGAHPLRCFPPFAVARPRINAAKCQSSNFLFI